MEEQVKSLQIWRNKSLQIWRNKSLQIEQVAPDLEEQVAPDRNLWGDLILTSQWTYGLVVFVCETKSCWLTHARCEVKLVEGYLTRHKIVISSCLLTCSM